MDKSSVDGEIMIEDVNAQIKKLTGKKDDLARKRVQLVTTARTVYRQSESLSTNICLEFQNLQKIQKALVTELSKHLQVTQPLRDAVYKLQRNVKTVRCTHFYLQLVRSVEERGLAAEQEVKLMQRAIPGAHSQTQTKIGEFVNPWACVNTYYLYCTYVSIYSSPDVINLKLFLSQMLAQLLSRMRQYCSDAIRSILVKQLHWPAHGNQQLQLTDENVILNIQCAVECLLLTQAMDTGMHNMLHGRAPTISVAGSSVMMASAANTTFTDTIMILSKANACISQVWAIQLLLEPIVKRFLFHFYGLKKTNRLDRPEWYLNYILAAIIDHLPFVKEFVQPIVNDIQFLNRDLHTILISHAYHSRKVRQPGQEPQLLVAIEFMSVLVNLTLKKMQSTLPRLLPASITTGALPASPKASSKSSSSTKIVHSIDSDISSGTGHTNTTADMSIEDIVNKVTNFSDNDVILFRHLVDHSLLFESELRNVLGYPCNLIGITSILTQPTHLLAWIFVDLLHLNKRLVALRDVNSNVQNEQNADINDEADCDVNEDKDDTDEDEEDDDEESDEHQETTTSLSLGNNAERAARLAGNFFSDNITSGFNAVAANVVSTAQASVATLNLELRPGVRDFVAGEMRKYLPTADELVDDNNNMKTDAAVDSDDKVNIDEMVEIVNAIDWAVEVQALFAIADSCSESKSRSNSTSIRRKKGENKYMFRMKNAWLPVEGIRHIEKKLVLDDDGDDGDGVDLDDLRPTQLCDVIVGLVNVVTDRYRLLPVMIHRKPFVRMQMTILHFYVNFLRDDYHVQYSLMRYGKILGLIEDDKNVETTSVTAKNTDKNKTDGTISNDQNSRFGLSKLNKLKDLSKLKGLLSKGLDVSRHLKTSLQKSIKMGVDSALAAAATGSVGTIQIDMDLNEGPWGAVCGQINSLHYLICVLSDWNDQLLFLELNYYQLHYWKKQTNDLAFATLTGQDLLQFDDFEDTRGGLFDGIISECNDLIGIIRQGLIDYIVQVLLASTSEYRSKGYLIGGGDDDDEDDASGQRAKSQKKRKTKKAAENTAPVEMSLEDALSENAPTPSADSSALATIHAVSSLFCYSLTILRQQLLYVCTHVSFPVRGAIWLKLWQKIDTCLYNDFICHQYINAHGCMQVSYDLKAMLELLVNHTLGIQTDSLDEVIRLYAPLTSECLDVYAMKADELAALREVVCVIDMHDDAIDEQMSDALDDAIRKTLVDEEEDEDENADSLGRQLRRAQEAEREREEQRQRELKKEKKQSQLVLHIAKSREILESYYHIKHLNLEDMHNLVQHIRK